jgi:PucR-like helix-turn-helix protein/diguanylate cyclase with GGDEF domain
MSVTLDVELQEERRRILTVVDGHLDEVVETAVDAIRADIPVYSDAPRALTADVRGHIRAHYRTKVARLSAEQPVTIGELGFSSLVATRRARSGVGLDDYINAYRISHRVFWDALLDCAGSGASGREAALTLATPLMRYCEVASTYAGHVFAEYLQRAVADADRERRELFEQLLAGEFPVHGPLRALAHGYGIAADSRLLAVVAVPAAAHADAAAAGAAFARAALGATRTLVIARHGEIAAVAALAAGCGAHKVCERVEALHARLHDQGLPLALGVSTPARGVRELPRAFAEARTALECVDGDGGVAALPLMSPLRYLTLSAPDTARRLVDPRLRTFLEQDLARGGALRDTIRVLAETDLKLGVAAARLQVHPNTLQYRVRRIQERTGRNPRRVADLLELLTAIALDDG